MNATAEKADNTGQYGRRIIGFLAWGAMGWYAFVSGAALDDRTVAVEVLGRLQPAVLSVSTSGGVRLHLRFREAPPPAVSTTPGAPGSPTAICEEQAVLTSGVELRPGAGNRLELRWPDGSATAEGGVSLRPAGAGNACRVRVQGIPERDYGGILVVRSEEGRLWVENRLPLGDYVAGVVGSEGGAGTPPEALAALAVLARTYAVRGAGRHGKADLCDTTHCQLYQGRAAVTAAAEAAARATAGKILSWQGAPARVLYHSTCGGTTASFAGAWGAPGPAYLEGVDDGGACRASPHFRWEQRIAHASLMDLLRDITGSDPSGMDAEDTGPGGWIRWITVRRADGTTVRMRGEEFHIRAGRRLGWNAIRSACFTVRREGGEWVFRGAGFGHGVGMCQWGAAELARRGWDHACILAHYFPGTTLIDSD